MGLDILFGCIFEVMGGLDILFGCIFKVMGVLDILYLVAYFR